MFTVEERLGQIKDSVKEAWNVGTNLIHASSFQGLLVEYAKRIDAQVLVRGIRSVSDFEYEINLANINKVLAPELETLFLPTSPELAVVSSSMVKEIAKCGGDISKFAPKNVVDEVNAKFGFVKTGEMIRSCPKCQSTDGLKMTDDKPSFCYCRVCGWFSPPKNKIAAP